MKLPYGIQNGKLVSIDEVDKGLACNSFCKKCKGVLIAKKGKVNVHHFAHYKVDDCGWTGESEIHLMAKKIIANSAHIKLPKLYWSRNPDVEIFKDDTTIKIDSVKLETKLDDIIPDILIQSGRKKLLIEIVVSNGISKEKLKKIRKIGIATLKIDARKIVNKLFKKGDYFLRDTSFENFLINETEFKSWSYNPKKEKIKAFLDKNHSKRFKIYYYENKEDFFEMYYVNNCPLEKRKWKNGIRKGYYYANVDENCSKCNYCVNIECQLEFEKPIKCIGHLKDPYDIEIQDIIKKYMA